MKPFWSPRIGGQEWLFFRVAPGSKHLRNEQGDRLVGQCEYEKCRVYFSNALTGGAFVDALWHEFLHILLWVSGAEKAYRGDPEIDEAIVTAMAPHAHRFFADLGFCFPVRVG